MCRTKERESFVFNITCDQTVSCPVVITEERELILHFVTQLDLKVRPSNQVTSIENVLLLCNLKKPPSLRLGSPLVSTKGVEGYVGGVY